MSFIWDSEGYRPIWPRACMMLIPIGISTVLDFWPLFPCRKQGRRHKWPTPCLSNQIVSHKRAHLFFKLIAAAIPAPLSVLKSATESLFIAASGNGKHAGKGAVCRPGAGRKTVT